MDDTVHVRKAKVGHLERSLLPILHTGIVGNFLIAPPLRARFVDQDIESRILQAKKGTVRHSMRNSFKASLGAGIELRDAIRLPPDEDRSEWIAMHSTAKFRVLFWPWRHRTRAPTQREYCSLMLSSCSHGALQHHEPCV